MAEVLTVAKSDFDAAQEEIKNLRGRLEAAKEDKVKEQVTALNSTIAAKDEEIKAVKTELDNTKASKTEAAKELETLKSTVAKLESELKEANEKISTHAKQIVTANRISTLVEKGVEKSEAEKIVEAAADTSDALFQILVDTHAKLVEAEKAKAEWMGDKDKKKDKKKEEKEAAKADENSLDNVEEKDEATLASETEVEEESVIAGLADFLTQEIESKRKK